jgi:hypothetical protein
MRPVPAQTTLSVSPSTVTLGSQVTLNAGVAAPRCTYDLINKQSRCWQSVNFAERPTYLPQNYSSDYNPPIVQAKNCGIPYYSRQGTSCSGTLVRGFGLARILTNRYMVETVETYITGPGNRGEIDIVEVAVGFGPQPKCGTTGAASSAACLQAYIKIVGPIPNVGTRSGLSVDNYVPSDGPMNFTKRTGSANATPLVEAASTGQQCVSGCANILIKVVNKATHKAATNAVVNVSLGPIDSGEAPALHQQGTQFLCLQTDSSVQHCGTSLDGLKLDENGQVRLLYWAPGELVSAHVELYAQACTASACALRRAQSKITVYPYRIFHYQGELSPETVAALVEMVREEGYFDIASHAAEFSLEATAKAWIELLGVQSHAVELALGPIGFAVAFTLIDLAHATSELLEEAGLRGAFFDASGLSEAGLLSDEFAKVLPPFASAEIEGEVLSGGKVITHPSGWLWELGKQLAEEYPYHTFHTLTDLKPEPLDLSVYETSYCSQYANQQFHSVGEEAHCGPGYGSLHSPNMHTDFCIDIVQLVVPICGGQYDAPIWVVSQEGVDKKLHHPGALDTSLP